MAKKLNHIIDSGNTIALCGKAIENPEKKVIDNKLNSCTLCLIKVLDITDVYVDFHRSATEANRDLAERLDDI